jgi:hypothetical protein
VDTGVLVMSCDCLACRYQRHLSDMDLDLFGVQLMAEVCGHVRRIDPIAPGLLRFVQGAYVVDDWSVEMWLRAHECDSPPD